MCKYVNIYKNKNIPIIIQNHNNFFALKASYVLKILIMKTIKLILHNNSQADYFLY